jgi:hypothetical protein
MSIVTSNIWLFIGVNGIDFVLGLFEMLIWRFPLEVYTFRWRTWDWLKVYADFCKILNSLVFLGLFVYWDCIGILIGSYPFFILCQDLLTFQWSCMLFSARFDSNACGFEWLPILHLKFIVLRLLRLRSFKFCFKQCVKENLLRFSHDPLSLSHNPLGKEKNFPVGICWFVYIYDQMRPIKSFVSAMSDSWNDNCPIIFICDSSHRSVPNCSKWSFPLVFSLWLLFQYKSTMT